MALTLAPEAPPLQMDSTGTIRVGGTRIAIDHLVFAHRAGMTPEQIAERFETLQLADVYAAIGYFIRHRSEVDEYLARREAEAAEIKAKILASQRPFPTRTELLTRRSFRTGERVPASGIWHSSNGHNIALSAGETFPPSHDNVLAEWSYSANDRQSPKS